MALLQVRNCPDDIYSAISEAAKSERRSIAQQAVYFIEAGMNVGGMQPEKRRKALARTLGRDVPDDFRSTDFTALIREDRDR